MPNAAVAQNWNPTGCAAGPALIWYFPRMSKRNWLLMIVPLVWGACALRANSDFDPGFGHDLGPGQTTAMSTTAMSTTAMSTTAGTTATVGNTTAGTTTANTTASNGHGTNGRSTNGTTAGTTTNGTTAGTTTNGTTASNT